MPEREFDDVWQEIRDKASRHLATSTPLKTLGREVPNVIKAVAADGISRLSANTRTGEGSLVRRSDVEAVWRELVEHDVAMDTARTLRLSFALIGRLINGVEFLPDPYRLVLVDRELATTPWVGGRTSPEVVEQARAELSNAIDGLRVYQRDGAKAPHKPLLLLLTLAEYAKGTAPRWWAFEGLERPLRSLISRFSVVSDQARPEEPIWRLQTSGIWTADVPGATGADPPSLATLRAPEARFGFTDVVDAALWASDTLATDAIDQLLTGFFDDDDARTSVRKSLGLAGDDTDSTAVGLLLKWSPSLRPDTVTLHRQIADRKGAVWWGLITAAPPPAAPKIAMLQQQVEARIETYAYLYRTGTPPGQPETTRARLLKITVDPEDVDDRLPDYYSAEDCRLFVLLRDFEDLEAGYAERHLSLVSAPGSPIVGALKNQPSAMLVLADARPLTPPAPPSHRVWWVNQGSSYATARAGGYIWAPTRTDKGSTLAYWTAVGDVRADDVIIHYANSKIRALGRALEDGRVQSQRPAGVTDARTVESGFFASVQYYELGQPIALDEVPDRGPAVGPFTTTGGVKEGYLFRVQEEFADTLRTTFGHRWPEDSPWGGTPTMPATPHGGLPGEISDLTLAAVRATLERRRLRLPETTVRTAVAALRAGKHLLLVGPPGTGKTEFATALAEAGAEAGLTHGHATTTATADWTSSDTIGGYRLTIGGGLEFAPGQVLEAIDNSSWLIIDEFNRADIDKALGQLFTVLSKHVVTLPFTERRDGREARPSIVPAGAPAPQGTHPHFVDARWRLLATLNTRDRDLLFNMSYALQRRFAIVDVPNPSPEDYARILADKASTGDPRLDARVVALSALPHRTLGPAILIDCGQYVRERLQLETAPIDSAVMQELLQEALFAFVFPQLDDLSRPQLREIVTHLHRRVLKMASGKETAAVVSQALQVPAEEITPASTSGFDEEVDEESADGPDLEPL